jgi:hypothetical protein
MQTGKPTDSHRRKAGTIPKVSHGRRCPRCPFYAPSGKCLNTTLRSGRCGDWVWYVCNGKQFRRLWSRPRDPRTPLQLYWRARLGAASKRYSQGLTDGRQDGCIAAGAWPQSRLRIRHRTTVGLIGGFWEDGAIGTQEESAVFRPNTRVWRMLRYSGPGNPKRGIQHKDAEVQRRFPEKLARPRAKRGRSPVR